MPRTSQATAAVVFCFLCFVDVVSLLFCFVMFALFCSPSLSAESESISEVLFLTIAAVIFCDYFDVCVIGIPNMFLYRCCDHYIFFFLSWCCC